MVAAGAVYVGVSISAVFAAAISSLAVPVSITRSVTMFVFVTTFRAVATMAILAIFGESFTSLVAVESSKASTSSPDILSSGRRYARQIWFDAGSNHLDDGQRQ